jgi:hypothetical protein
MMADVNVSIELSSFIVALSLNIVYRPDETGRRTEAWMEDFSSGAGGAGGTGGDQDRTGLNNRVSGGTSSHERVLDCPQVENKDYSQWRSSERPSQTGHTL